MNGWDTQIGLITLAIAGILPIIKNLPWIGPYIKDWVAVVADLILGVGVAGWRAFFIHDVFYHTPPVWWIVVGVGLIAGALASGGYKTLSELFGKIGKT